MWRDEAYLLDMLIAARRAREFARGLTFEGFEQSSLHQNAMIRTLQVLGEAARKISPEGKQAHPEIPWPEIIGLRYRLVHDYFRIDLPKVWDVVENDIPRLIPLLEAITPPEEA